MRGLMPSAISRRTGGPKRRRSSSFSIAFRRFSASSSSTSTSSLRVTRNVWCSWTTMPGNSCSRCSEMTSSTGTNDIGPFSGDAACTSGALGRPDASTAMNRGSSGGTLTRAKCSLPVAGLVTTTARFSDSPEMYGNGCAGSTASGVSTGKICRRKNLRSRSCSLSPSSSQRTSVMPSCASAGCTCSANTAAWRAVSLCASSLIASRTCRGDSPDAAVTAMPVAMRRLRPATRTMKNSSRLDAKIARNRTRSSSGMSASSASSSTRWLNASQESSRSRNRSVGQAARRCRCARRSSLWAMCSAMCRGQGRVEGGGVRHAPIVTPAGELGVSEPNITSTADRTKPARSYVCTATVFSAPV